MTETAVATPVEAEAPLLVKFSDGKEISFGKKKILDKDWHKDESTGQLFIDLYFRNGQSRSYGLQSSLLERYAVHGGLQKYGDNIAGVKDVDEAVYDSDELYTQLEAGEWRSQREGTGPSGSSVLAKAFITLALGSVHVDGFEAMSAKEKVAAVASRPQDAEYEATLERVKTFLRTLSPQEKTAFRELDETISPLVAAIEAEKAKTAPKVDTASLLAKF